MYSSFMELDVWKECRKLRQMVSALCKKFPSDEKYKLTDQILRSSKSPCANIAEGHGRYHYQENIQFCRIARGSVTETHNHLTDALDEKYILEEEYTTTVEQINSCIRLINGYINFLQKQKANTKQTTNNE
ncbi:MAG: four helix bundle protein [Bacteroidia bacterium]|jgi:four helix bundle protein|nr:four helix bundle protein [Bacteroidia bacterium]MBP7261169.1 four helix bundle protein [Bacteroidia bacterium]MBP9180047.1 four helix bundle protein [Bacteroidia bacterium]MBP9725225.1 four helix bundle protein [Bacteroidia bacterium]